MHENECVCTYFCAALAVPAHIYTQRGLQCEQTRMEGEGRHVSEGGGQGNGCNSDNKEDRGRNGNIHEGRHTSGREEQGDGDSDIDGCKDRTKGRSGIAHGDGGRNINQVRDGHVDVDEGSDGDISGGKDESRRNSISEGRDSAKNTAGIAGRDRGRGRGRGTGGQDRSKDQDDGMILM